MHSTGFTILFAAAVCGVCSIVVSGSAVMLRDRQEENRVLDRQLKVLNVAGLAAEGEVLPRDEIRSRFENNVVPLVVDRESGEVLEDVEPAQFDPAAEMSDPATSVVADPNEAQVRRLPNRLLLYQVKDGNDVKLLVLPVEGKGLWSTLYGFLALESDLNTVAGITFYQHGETPGLGGEVDNPRWKARWPGRKVFDENWEPKIEVKKGAAGTPEQDPYFVDGLSGATITSRGVTHLVHFWLDENGYGPYLQKYRAEHGID